MKKNLSPIEALMQEQEERRRVMLEIMDKIHEYTMNKLRELNNPSGIRVIPSRGVS